MTRIIDPRTGEPLYPGGGLEGDLADLPAAGPAELAKPVPRNHQRKPAAPTGEVIENGTQVAPNHGPTDQEGTPE